MSARNNLDGDQTVAPGSTFDQISQKYRALQAAISRSSNKKAESARLRRKELSVHQESNQASKMKVTFEELEAQQKRYPLTPNQLTTMATSIAEPTPQSQTSLIRTRLLIISDTHGHTPTFNPQIPFHHPLPNADVLIHCGDLTMVGYLSEFKTTLNMISSHPAPLKLVIAGNHDISLDPEYFGRRGKYMQRSLDREFDPDLPSKARALWTSPEAVAAGVRYLDEGIHTFTLSNGAMLRVFASAYTPEFCSWAFAYERDQQPFMGKMEEAPAVDVMITHGPPYGVLDATNPGEHVGCFDLLRASWCRKPLVHCFGHIHEGWGAQRVEWESARDGDVERVLGEGRIVQRVEDVEMERESLVKSGAACVNTCKRGAWEVERGKQTLMVNASIMNLSYDPLNAPWVVDVELPKEEGKEHSDQGDAGLETSQEHT